MEIMQRTNRTEIMNTFIFRRPFRKQSPKACASAKLEGLEEWQHDVMYCLAGCDDVISTISKVNHRVG